MIQKGRLNFRRPLISSSTYIISQQSAFFRTGCISHIYLSGLRAILGFQGFAIFSGKFLIGTGHPCLVRIQHEAVLLIFALRSNNQDIFRRRIIRKINIVGNQFIRNAFAVFHILTDAVRRGKDCMADPTTSEIVKIDSLSSRQQFSIIVVIDI